MTDVEYTVEAAFERMHLCGNKECSAYGDDTPDPGDNHCLMCGSTKVHWTTIPEKDIEKGIWRCLVRLHMIERSSSNIEAR
jgi:hypothetical protein